MAAAPPVAAETAPVLFRTIFDDPAILRAVRPLEFLRAHLAKDVRPDGRAPGESRPVHAVAGFVSTCDGSALVKLGPTTALAGIQCMVMRPSEEEPRCGGLVVKVSLSPISSPSVVEAGTGGETASGTARGSSAAAEVLSHRLTEMFVTTHVLDRSSLCIEEGKHAWCLNASVTLLDDAGSAMDALCCALTLALADTRLPRVQVTPLGVRRLDAADDAEARRLATPLPLTHLLCPASFAFIPSYPHPLVDPTVDEETLRGALLQLAAAVPLADAAAAPAADDAPAHLVSQRSTGPIPPAALARCQALARDHAAAVAAALREALAVRRK